MIRVLARPRLTRAPMRAPRRATATGHAGTPSRRCARDLAACRTQVQEARPPTRRAMARIVILQAQRTATLKQPTRTRRGPRHEVFGPSARCRKWRSRPISRVLSWTVIPLGAASPLRSSSLPGPDAGNVMRSLFGLAPGGVCRAGLLPGSRCALTAPFHPCHATCEDRSAVSFCCTFRRLAPPRRYLAPCPVEPGLSSAPHRNSCDDATVWPTPPARLWHVAAGRRALTVAREVAALKLTAASPGFDDAGPRGTAAALFASA